MTGPDWWRALPAAETWVPCGDGTHPVRWADGQLSLPAHGDPEAEAVLAALGGEMTACQEVAEAWHRHSADLSVLAVGPRAPDDDVGVSWDDVRDFRENRLGGRYTRRRGGGRVVGSAGPALAGGRVGSRPMIPAGGLVGIGGPGPSPELERLRTERLELLTLLALGPAFHLALSGTVAASFGPGGSRAPEVPDHRPELEVALTGRLAPVAEAWLGVDPDLVDVRLPGQDPGGRPDGGGELELVGSGAGPRLHAVLPVTWLATVWAPGLALVGPGRRHLVVAVERAAYPEATVLAVAAPGRDPVRLTVRATGDDPPHWEITDPKEEGTP